VTSLKILLALRRIILGYNLDGDGTRNEYCPIKTKASLISIKQGLQAIFFGNPDKCMEHSTISDLFLFDINDLSLKLQLRLCGANRKGSCKL